MKNILVVFTLLFSINLISQTPVAMQNNSIHQFKVEALSGGEIDFSDFKGKKILIVNTASKCGYTPQYEGLEALYNEHKDNLVVVGFPANNFGAQEPGSNDEISAFCEQNYGVSFPMAAKVSVKGQDIAPIFDWLTSKTENGSMDVTIKWNFTKFLLDENGQLTASFESKVKPESEEILAFLNP
nr:glutathione peroxidase [Gelidibacter japonicus]